MEQTHPLRKTGRKAAMLLGCAAALSACAGGERLPPAPQASSVSPAQAMLMRSEGYQAPAVEEAAFAAPPRAAKPEPATEPLRASAAAQPLEPKAPASSNPYFTPTAEGEAEVPPPPRRAYAAPARVPLPDLDGIVVTDSREPVRTAQVFEGETRSVMPSREVRPEPAPSPAPTPAADPEPADSPVSPARPAPAAGQAAIHLASYRSDEMAEAGWLVLTREHGAILAGMSPARRVVEIPGQGRFVRLIAGPLQDRQARTACSTLERQGTYCAVVDWSQDEL